jgi:hypothetical protein
MKPIRNILLLATVAALLVSAVAAGTASASVWKFNGTELGAGVNETVVGAAISSSMTIPGVTTECKHFLYNSKVKDSGGAGSGEITELPLYECTTNTTSCSVESIEAKKLPWPLHLATFGGKDYVVIEKVEVEIHYAGALCAFSETPVIVKGSAGGVVENSAQTVTFNKTTLEASGTSLKVGATSIEWNGVFTAEPFESRREELIEA